MSVGLSEFWARLVKGGMAEAADCKRLANEYANTTGAPPSSASELAKWLADAGVITEFQAKSLLSATPAEIRHGDFVQTSDQTVVPLSYWMPVRSTIDGSSGFLIRAGAGQLTPQQFSILHGHAAISANSLQPFQISGDVSNGVSVYSAIPAGNCLSELTTRKKKVERRQALTIGLEIASALQAMHSANLVHGSVRADRVWITSDGQPLLLRDPSSMATPPRTDTSASWIDVKESPGWYSAPEFVDTGAVCSTSTDIYALGCLIFRMVVGRMPFDGATIDQQIQAHATEVPAELAAAIEQGESGDPILRVIAYAMAKSPAARFADINQLSNALSAVVNIVDSHASSTSKVSTPLTQKTDKPKPKTERPSPRIETPAQEQIKTSAKSAVPQKSAVPPASPSPSPATPPPTPTGKRERSVTSPEPPPLPAKSKPSKARVSSPTTASEPPPKPAKNTKSSAPTVSNSAAATPPTKPPASPKIETGPTPPPAPSVQRPPPAASEAKKTSEEEDTQKPRRRRRRKNSKAPLILGAMCVPILMLIIALIVQGFQDPVAEKKDRVRPPLPDKIPSVRSSSSKRPTSSGSGVDQSSAPKGYQLVTDDNLLWVPPFGVDQGSVPLDLLPPGPGMIVSIRIAALKSDAASQQLLDAFSPELSSLLDMASNRAKVPLDSIERCTLAFHAGRSGSPSVSMAIELTEEEELDALLGRWNAGMSLTPEGVTLYAGDESGADAYFLGDSEKGKLPAGAKVKRFAVGAIQQMTEVAQNEGGPIPLPRYAEKLWKSSNAGSDLVVFAIPNFLFSDARNLLLRSVPELEKPMQAVLGSNVAAFLVSAKSTNGTFYSELRAVPVGGISVPELLTTLKDQIRGWPRWAELFNADSSPDPSWKLLAGRLPGMMRFLIQHTRFGADQEAVVANAYLPSNAAAQLGLATVLAMNTKPGSTVVATNTPTSSSPLTLEQILDQKITLEFGKETLEDTVALIAEELKNGLPSNTPAPSISLVLSEMRKDGITQNQSIVDFKKLGVPVRQVLTDVVRAVNPDPEATDSNDSRQILIWVVNKNDQGNVEILITTRSGAADMELPKEFVVAP